MQQIVHIANYTTKAILQQTAVRLLMCIIGVLIIYAGIIGLLQYKKAEVARAKYQKEVRDSWVNSPNKHPHRMAHYGFIAFRPKSSLSIFDYGVESYTGNVIFLEAHRQNSTNFSEASLSSSLLRFGEISIAMILQILLPLYIFFIGFNCISNDRENGTLKILLSQGLGTKQLLIGKIFGISIVALYIIFPTIIYAFMLNVFVKANATSLVQLLLSFIIYIASIFIYSSIAVIISAISNSSKQALVLLIGIWLFLIIVLPRLTQMAANSIYSIPSKIAFETAIEKDIIKEGDSHNPDDKHFKTLKDSTLKANNADSIQQLNFNYGGVQMMEGERISAKIYNKHLDSLMHIFKMQNKLQVYTSFINPFLSIKQLSMALSQTDFDTYTNFQQQAENYRYDLAQEMNALQIKLIPNKKLADTAKSYSIDKKNWATFKDFKYQKPALQSVLSNQVLPFISLLIWVMLAGILIIATSNKFKAI